MTRPGAGWRGYIFSRPIAGQTIPQRVQNLVVRSYAERHGLRFLLSAVEYHMPGSAMMLESLVAGIKGVEGLIFYSMNMLPDDAGARRRLYARTLKARRGLRFALEELALRSRDDAALLEDILACRALSRRTDPASLPL